MNRQQSESSTKGVIHRQSSELSLKGGILRQQSESSLARHAESVELLKAASASFPMFTVLGEDLLKMTSVRPHEALRADGVVTEFDPALGKAAFVSHEWVGKRHPDPDMRQFRVLQDALRNVLSGEARVMVDMPTELSIGLSKAAESTCALAHADRIFFWYDYFSCPQLEGQESPGVPTEKSALRDAVNSIPAYIAQSDLFLALCPVLTSREKQSLLSHSTWSNRGWCRVELAVRELSSKVPDCILVKSPVHLEMKVETSVKSAGEGVFTVESDRAAIAPVLNNFFKSKLSSLLKGGDFPKYRLLLNQQRARLRGLHVQSVEDLVPSFDDTGSPGCNYTNRFLHQNGFQHLNECDAAGWTPICYAAVKGDPTLVEALLDARANPNDTTRKPRMDADIGKRTPVLCISIKFQNLKVAELLIRRRAAINVKNNFLPPLHFAAFTNNPEAVKTLCRHRADLGIKNSFGLSAWHSAAMSSSDTGWDALDELLAQHDGPPDPADQPLFTCAINGAAPRAVARLVAARADVNRQYKPSLLEPLGAFLQIKSLLHRAGTRSMFSTWAYHHYKMTPLMTSLLFGNFEVASALLMAGASTGVKNYRSKTALDFAKDIHAPSYLLAGLQGDLMPCQLLFSGRCPEEEANTEDLFCV